VFSELQGLGVGSGPSSRFERLSDRGIDAIAGLSQLKALAIGNFSEDIGPGAFSDAQLAEILSSGAPLEIVSLQCGQPSRQTLEALARISTLTSLILRTPYGPDDEAFRGLPPFSNLKDLTIQNIGPEGIRWLGDLPKLEWLRLPESAITWESIETLRQIPHLNYIIIIDGGEISDPALRDAVDQEWILE
jgi:hypothetical protein